MKTIYDPHLQKNIPEDKSLLKYFFFKEFLSLAHQDDWSEDILVNFGPHVHLDFPEWWLAAEKFFHKESSASTSKKRGRPITELWEDVYDFGEIPHEMQKYRLYRNIHTESLKIILIALKMYIADGSSRKSPQNITVELLKIKIDLEKGKPPKKTRSAEEKLKKFQNPESPEDRRLLTKETRRYIKKAQEIAYYAANAHFPLYQRI